MHLGWRRLLVSVCLLHHPPISLAPHRHHHQVLRRVVWAPEPDFLRLLQNHFQREEGRYQDAAARAEAQVCVMLYPIYIDR